MTEQQREMRIEYLAGRIAEADRKADCAADIVADASDELRGAQACRLADLADELRERIERQSQRRDVWAAAANSLRNEAEALQRPVGLAS